MSFKSDLISRSRDDSKQTLHEHIVQRVRELEKKNGGGRGRQISKCSQMRKAM